MMNVDLCARGTVIQERELSTISVNMGRLGVQHFYENRANGGSEVCHGQGELRGEEGRLERNWRKVWLQTNRFFPDVLSLWATGREGSSSGS